MHYEYTFLLSRSTDRRVHAIHLHTINKKLCSLFLETSYKISCVLVGLASQHSRGDNSDNVAYTLRKYFLMFKQLLFKCTTILSLYLPTCMPASKFSRTRMPLVQLNFSWSRSTFCNTALIFHHQFDVF